MLGMLVSGGVSGGHLNPAVTVAVASVGKFPWRKVSWCQRLPCPPQCAPLLDPAGAALPRRAVPGRAAGELLGVPRVLGRAGLLRARQVGGGGVARRYSSCAGAATAPRRTLPPSSPPTPPRTSPWPGASSTRSLSSLSLSSLSWHVTTGQVVVTALLLLCICAITDQRNMKVGWWR